MKKMTNVYVYTLEFSYDENTNKVNTTLKNDCIYACYPKRNYKTKMKPTDLPEHYCDVQRYGACHNIINSKDVIDLKYTWVKENHFMKDSVLRISYSGKLQPYYDTFTYDDKEITSKFVSYKNVDAKVYGNDILKFLGYVHKYSNYDITEIRSEFIKQCEWLRDNEPNFAPDTSDFGQWFDNKIKL